MSCACLNGNIYILYSYIYRAYDYVAGSKHANEALTLAICYNFRPRVNDSRELHCIAWHGIAEDVFVTRPDTKAYNSQAVQALNQSCKILHVQQSENDSEAAL